MEARAVTGTGIGDSRAKAEAERRLAVQAAWAEWLDAMAWDHFATLTFKINTGPDYARRAFLGWVRQLERAAGTPVVWFVGFENGRQLGRLHLHALMGNTADVPMAFMGESWTAGYSRILRYVPHFGAAHYVTKYVTKELLDYDVSPNFDKLLAINGRQLRFDLSDALPRRKP